MINSKQAFVYAICQRCGRKSGTKDIMNVPPFGNICGGCRVTLTKDVHEIPMEELTVADRIARQMSMEEMRDYLP